MHLDDSSPQPISFRPRFGLKLLFIATTVLAVHFGYRAARERSIAEIVGRHNAVLTQLRDNMSSTPDGLTMFQTPPPRPMRPTQSYRPPPWPGDFGVPAILSKQGKLTGSATSTFLLTPIPSRGIPLPGSHRASQIRQHYEREFTTVGLTRTMTADGDHAATAMWTMEGMDIVVLIDVRFEDERKHVRVSVQFIESQQLAVW
jgi:hypothetical protein